MERIEIFRIIETLMGYSDGHIPVNTSEYFKNQTTFIFYY